MARSQTEALRHETSYTVKKHCSPLGQLLEESGSPITGPPSTFDEPLPPKHRCSLVFLAVVSQDKILELHLHLDPLLIGQGGPDVVGLRNCSLVWL